jgi:UrcA family protein
MFVKTSARFAVILSTALLLGWSAVTFGAPTRAGDVATKTVTFADLDISTADGAQALYERIATAARSVCRGEEIRFAHACRTRAIADAVKDVGSPLLSAMHRSTMERVEEVVRR